jgi:uncharacterized membrane protein
MRNQPFIIPAILFLLLSLPPLAGLLPPNRFYGVRTPVTLADRRLWNNVNRFAAVALLISSLIYLLTAALLPCSVSGRTDMGLWSLHLLAFAGPLLTSLLLIRRRLRRLP